MSKLTDKISELASPVCEACGCELWDVEFVKEAGQYVLRVFIDKPEGVGIDDCEAVSRALDPILDEEDPIEQSYVFEVSSAGAERELRRPPDFERFLGEKVEVKLYSAVNGSKSHIGQLLSYENGDVTVLEAGQEQRYAKSAVAMVRLRIV